MSFDEKKWVAVLDTKICEYSRKQSELIADLKLELKGVVDCSNPEHEKSEICSKVPAFPCFCNIETSSCYTGYRNNIDKLHELEKL